MPLETPHSARTLAEQERLAASLNQASKTQAAIDFIVKRLVPEKLIAMARTRRSRVAKSNAAGETGWQSWKDVPKKAGKLRLGEKPRS